MYIYIYMYIHMYIYIYIYTHDILVRLLRTSIDHKIPISRNVSPKTVALSTPYA